MDRTPAIPRPIEARHKLGWAVKILRAQLPDPTPEERLWFAVIEQALRDTYSNDECRSAEARAWIGSQRFAEVAVALGLHPPWVRTLLHTLCRPSL